MKRERAKKETDSLSYYLRQITRYPLLTIDQERSIAISIQDIRQKVGSGHLQDSDRKALEDQLVSLKDRLIRSNLRLVVAIAKKYQNRGLPLIDLIDEGNIGLIEAVERYDHTRGCKFSTYSSWWIKQAIIKGLADKGRTIRIPVHMLNSINHFYSMSLYLSNKLGRPAHNDELRKFLGISEQHLDELRAYAQDAVSLDKQVDEEGKSALVDIIEDRRLEEPDERIFTYTLQQLLCSVLNTLTPREQLIIQLRYGLNGEGPHTLKETGEILGLTRERIRQIQQKAIEKLKSSGNMKLLEEIE